MLAEGREDTLVLQGEQNALDAITHFFSRVSKTSRLMIDSAGISSIILVDDYNAILKDLVRRGVRRLCLTEITPENVGHCKELSKVLELRHLEGIRGNFAGSETEYLASAKVSQTVPTTQVIYSNAATIVEQHQSLFEMLWSKAVPAKVRIAEIESGISAPSTFTLSDPSDIAARTRHVTERSKWLNICCTFDGMRMFRRIALDSIRLVLDEQKNGMHTGIRWIGTIEECDIEVVDEFVKLGVEIRHIKSTPLNFSVTDKDCSITVSKLDPGQGNPSVLASNDAQYVTHFNALFEELWIQGVDAADRISEISDSIKPKRTEIINRSSIIRRTLLELIANAKHEILFMLPTERAYKREEKMGAIDILKRAAHERAVSVRILTPFDASPFLKTQNKRSRGNEDAATGRTDTKLQVKQVEQASEFETTLVLTDRKQSLVINLKNDSVDDFLEAVGTAIYSDAEPMVKSYTSFFEALWRESELSEEVRNTNEQLEANDRLQKEFIHIAAHELKTPVQPLLVLAELLAQEASSNDGVRVSRSDVELIARNAARLERLTSDILDVSRIESSTLSLNKTQVDLTEIISSVIKDSVTRRQDARILFESRGRPLIVEADRDRIMQIVFNLVDNAVKFTRSNGGEVFIQHEKSVGQAVVTVQDTGPGIDPEIEPRLFEKFASKSENGTGLGLYISKKIIEAHGGRIWAKNANGGAYFAFSLPIKSARN